MGPFFWSISLCAGAVLLVYVALWLSPDRRRLFLPTDHTERLPEDPTFWPPAAIVVPARNEADALPATLPTWLAQDYPHLVKVLLVDDRSQDGTAATAKTIAATAERPGVFEVRTNDALPAGWAGKVWAMHNGIKHLLHTHPDLAYVLLTDADIAHAPDSLRNLVRQSLHGQLGFNSRMARLRCDSFAEKWLIPPFLYFFLLLYPLKKANNPASRLASGAGGCVLLSREAVARLGEGLEPIRGCIIDDVNLAKAVKDRGLPIHLSLSVHTVTSTRPYPQVRDIAKMVTRSAYCQLNYNPLLLGAALLFMAALFIAPAVAIFTGLYGVFTQPVTGALARPFLENAFLIDVGAAALFLQLLHFKQALDFFRLSPWRALTFPAAGLVYAWMTLQSALRHWRGQGPQWRVPS